MDGGMIDATRFERMLDEGRAAAGGNDALAASLLGRALGLWRGPAYGELAYEDFAHAEAERLEELRLMAHEERIDAELALGRHAELLAEVCSLARAHPLREKPPAQAMLALYRCGRQSEALDLHAAAYARLRDELGLEPSAELRELQRRNPATGP
jgi:DNA-binding SARP family transcriptional activator